MPFGERLRKTRKEHHLSVPQLARLIMVSSQAIYQWEWGNTEPSLSYLISLADIFKISLDELAGRTVPSNEV